MVCISRLGLIVITVAAWANGVVPVQGQTLVATNIQGSDGTPSTINFNTPEVPLVISNIQGLAVSNPAAPGDNWLLGGRNNNPDARIGDRYFQGGATASVTSATSLNSLLLLEAMDGGVVGTDAIHWSVKTYQHYDGLGNPIPTLSNITQTSSTFAASSIGFNVTGTIVAGAKFLVDNSGVNTWGIGGAVDIDGDGVPQRILAVNVADFTAVSGLDTNTSHDFNYATLTLFTWEIANGQFAYGSFDITCDKVTTVNVLYPKVDRFDVILVPEPASLVVLALGVMAIWGRRRFQS